MKSLIERRQLIRHPERIRSSDVIKGVFSDLIYYESPDPSLIAARGYVDGIQCLVLGQEKPRKDSKATGMMTAKGYEFVLKLLEEAQDNKIPVVPFIDTYGGDATMQSEEDGQSFRISDCISFFSKIETPTLSYIIGEGGSGGALALQVTDKSFMLENALYGVISPESCAKILFDKRKTKGESLEDKIDALEILQPGAEHIKELGMIDEILPEPEEGAHINYEETIDVIRNSLIENLNEWYEFDKKEEVKKLKGRVVKKLVKERREKVLDYGQFEGSVRRVVKKFRRKRKPREVKIIDAASMDASISQAMKDHLKRKGIEGTEATPCELEWNKLGERGGLLFRVAGGCGYVDPKKFKENFYACPSCGKGDILTAEENLEKICDDGSFEETEEDLTLNRLRGKSRYQYELYLKKLERAENNEGTFSQEALVTGIGNINGDEVVLAISDPAFMGGSFGAVAGEKFKRAVDLAIKKRAPLISLCSSGGARMYEGTLSLAQMAKMNMALLDLEKRGIPFISVIAEPTTGGAYASYVTQGFPIIGEKGSLAEFAGPRVVISGFGGAVSAVDPKVVCTDRLFENKHIQYLVDRKDLKGVLSRYVRFFHKVKHPKR